MIFPVGACRRNLDSVYADAGLDVADGAAAAGGGGVDGVASAGAGRPSRSAFSFSAF